MAFLEAAGKRDAASGTLAICSMGRSRVFKAAFRMFGAFLDSTFDRYADLMLFLGLLVYYVDVDRFTLRRSSLRSCDGRSRNGQLLQKRARQSRWCLNPMWASGIGLSCLVLMIVGALDESHVARALDSGHRPEYHRHPSHRPHLGCKLEGVKRTAAKEAAREP